MPRELRHEVDFVAELRGRPLPQGPLGEDLDGHEAPGQLLLVQVDVGEPARSQVGDEPEVVERGRGPVGAPRGCRLVRVADAQGFEPHVAGDLPLGDPGIGLGLAQEGRRRGQGGRLLLRHDVDHDGRLGGGAPARVRDDRRGGAFGPAELMDQPGGARVREVPAHLASADDEALARLHGHRPQFAREVVADVVGRGKGADAARRRDLQDLHAPRGQGDPRRLVLDPGGDQARQPDVVDPRVGAGAVEDRRLGYAPRHAPDDVAPQVVHVPDAGPRRVGRPESGERVDHHPRDLPGQREVLARVGGHEDGHLGDEAFVERGVVPGGRAPPPNREVRPFAGVVEVGRRLTHDCWGRRRMRDPGAGRACRG